MPAWNEYKEMARTRGALAFELFVVESIPAAPPEEMQAVLSAHLAYQANQEAKGNLFLAGPLSDATGEMMSGAGLIIYRASSIEAAQAIADGDPMHAQAKRKYTLRKWLINEGSLSISLQLSNQITELS